MEHLAGDVMEADYLVDLSNVARMSDPPGPGLHQLARVIDALVTQDDDPEVSVYLVADKSLPNALARPDGRTVRAWAGQGHVELLGDADERLLELAELTGLSVISRDRYRDHRDLHPWLQGNTTQFLEPFVDNKGRMVVRSVNLGRLGDTEMSGYAEKALLKKQGLLSRGDVLDRTWRCPVPSCTLYDASRGRFVLLPRIIAGEPTCEIHSKVLADEGPRQSVVPMKLVVDGRCAHRFVVQAGNDVVVGREFVEVFAGVDAAEAAKVSRNHLALSYEGGKLTVRDASTHGTAIVPSKPERRLSRSERWVLRLGETARLTARIGITRSGRRFPTELSTVFDPRPDDDQSTR